MRKQSYINTFKNLSYQSDPVQPFQTMLRIIMENYESNKVTIVEEIMMTPSIARADPITESRLYNHLNFLAWEGVICAKMPGSIGWCTGKDTPITTMSEISFNWFFIADYRKWLPETFIPSPYQPNKQNEEEVQMNINQSAIESLDNPTEHAVNVEIAKEIISAIITYGGADQVAGASIQGKDFGGNKHKVLSVLQLLKAFGLINYTLINGQVTSISRRHGVDANVFTALLAYGEPPVTPVVPEATEAEPPAVVIIRLMGISFTVKEVQDLYWSLMDRIEYLEDKGTKHSTILSKVGINDDVKGMKEMIDLIHGTGLVSGSVPTDKPVNGQAPGQVSTGGFAAELRDALRADIDSFDRRRLIQPANPIGENDILPFHVNSDRFTNLANFRYTDYARLMDNHRDTSIDQEFLIMLIKRGVSEKDLQESTKDENIKRQYKSMTDIMQLHLVIRPSGNESNPVFHFTESFKDHWNTFVGSGATRLPDCRI